MTDIILPSNPKDKQEIVQVLRNVSDSMTRIAGEKEAIKEWLDEASEKYEIPKKTLNKLAQAMHKENLREIVNEVEDLQALYESLTGKAVEE